MCTKANDRHDKIKSMGKLGKHDAVLWIHSNGFNDINGFHFFVTVECNEHEWDFRNVTDAWLWFYDEQIRRKKMERDKKNTYQRNRYWKQHRRYIEGGKQ